MDRIRRKKKRMDRLSGLPNEIICHIVSFVSAKEAAFIKVLSKRFQNLYNIIPNLEFWDKYESQGSLTDFLDGVLALPASSRIRKFSIDCSRTVEPAHYAHVNRCLCDVLKRGVLDLALDPELSKHYKLPFEVYTCKTLVRLRLGSDIVFNVIPENACLPALEEAIPVFKKLLHLLSIANTINNECCPILPLLLKQAPNLETLVIKGSLHYDKNGKEPGSICQCLSEYSCLLPCRVKVLDITMYRLEVEQLKHFLGKLSCLELLKVHYWERRIEKEEKLRLTKDLLNHPRASKCKIICLYVGE